MSFPKLTALSGGMFKYCHELTTAKFPQITSINSSDCFQNCDKLELLEIPSITFIGNDTFNEAGNRPLTIVMGSNQPDLGSDISRNINGKTFTVKVPSGATLTDYDEDWKSRFSQRGINITVDVVEY